MANIFDYVKEQGKLTINEKEFNEIDNLILSRFSYFPFEDIIEDDEEVTIKELSNRFKKENVEDLMILWDDDIEFFPLLGRIKRFKDLKATKYVNKISVEKEIQFSAITVIMPNDTLYISYRGTDNTIVAWKENFNMCVKNHIPSQRDAVKYLEEIAKKYPSKKIILGGHSKGGNLAIYAAAFTNEEIKKRIISIYNNDGPGFNDEIINSDEYKEILEKINTYIPEDSIFGRLLNHQEEFTVIKSSKKGFMQHDLYTWQIEGDKFEYLPKVSESSNFIDKTIRQWFEKIDIKQREEVTDLMFQVLYTTEVDTFEEIGKAWFEKAKVLFKSYKSLDKESRKMIMQTLSALVKIIKDNYIFDHVTPHINKLKIFIGI